MCICASVCTCQFVTVSICLGADEGLIDQNISGSSWICKQRDEDSHWKEAVWRMCPCQNIFTQQSYSVSHFTASNNKQTHNLMIYRSDKHNKKKKKEGTLQKKKKCSKKTDYFFSPIFPSSSFSRRRSTSLNLMQNVRWFLWKILKFAYYAWQSHPISQQKCISDAAVWSKWKRFQSPQSACVILYLGHTNWETGDAKWHHYSSKCSAPFDFLCISVVFFKMLFFYLGWQFAAK